MYRRVLICFAFILTASCATVGEFPFHELNGNTEDHHYVIENSDHEKHEDSEVKTVNTPPEMFGHSERHSAEPVTEHLSTKPLDEKPAVKNSIGHSTDHVVTWDQPPSPLFSILRDFFFQARDGLLDPKGAALRSIADESSGEKNDKVIKAFERGVIETTTLLASQVENLVVSTIPPIQPLVVSTIPPIQPLVASTVTPTAPTIVPGDLTKRFGEAASQEFATENDNGLSLKDARQIDQIANLSLSCSNCYDTLHSCVQQCFESHNCNDLERKARSCPAVSNSLCNFFTSWNPVDECQSNEDCKSPLLCCNDRCAKKCVSGIWAS